MSYQQNDPTKNNKNNSNAKKHSWNKLSETLSLDSFNDTATFINQLIDSIYYKLNYNGPVRQYISQPDLNIT